MPASSQQTLGEVARRLDDVFHQYETLANSLTQTFVQKELFEAYKALVEANENTMKTVISAQDKRIADLEDDKKWLYRLIVGAVALAVIGIVVGANAIGKVH